MSLISTNAPIAVLSGLPFDVRQQVDLDQARRAVRALQRAFVQHRRALREHALDLRLDLARRLRADDLLEGRADDPLRVAPERFGVLAIRELAAEVARAVVGDQHRHVVGEQPEQPRLRLRRTVASAVSG
jgi:hypothetical protein